MKKSICIICQQYIYICILFYTRTHLRQYNRFSLAYTIWFKWHPSKYYTHPLSYNKLLKMSKLSEGGGRVYTESFHAE